MRISPHIRVQLVIPNDSGSEDYYTAMRDIRSVDSQVLIKFAAKMALLDLLSSISHLQSPISQHEPRH